MPPLTCRQCGRDALWGTLFCPHCGTYLRTWFVGWTAYLTLGGVVCAVILIWLAEFLSAQYRKPNADEWRYLPKPLAEVSALLAEAVPNPAELRLEPRGNFNLQIFLSRRRFEALSERARYRLVKRIIQVWCTNVPPSAFVPFVQIRDDQTSGELLTARCPLFR